MSKILMFRSRRQTMREASEWLSRMDRGLNTRERLALQEWLASDRRCSMALLELAAFWDDIAVLRELSDLFPLPSAKPARRWLNPVVFRSGTAVMAALTFAWLSPLGTSLLKTGVPESASVQIEAEGIISTVIGGQHTERLPDGSTVNMNTDSSIEVAFDEVERRLVVHRGEASFTVVSQPDRPFIVIAGSREIRAVGTAFNVRIRENGQLDVLVTEGEVLVKELSSRQREPQERQQPAPTVEISLVAGELLIINPQELQVLNLTAHDSSTLLAWQLGMLVFNGEPLQSVLDEITRYTEIDFRIAQEELRELRVGGIFKAGDVNGLLLSLSLNFGVDVTREDAGTSSVITLYRDDSS